MKTKATATIERTLHTFRRAAALTILLAWGGLNSLLPAEASTPGGPEGFVLVKGGTFQMGDLWDDGGFAMGETPVHEVTVGDFLLGKYEVTVAGFARFVAATGQKTEAEAAAGSVVNRGVMKDEQLFYPHWRTNDWCVQGPDHPVLMIAWEDAIAYCNWLSRQHRLSPAYDQKNGRLLDPSGQPTTEIRRTTGFRLPTEAEWEFAARERGRKVRFGNGQDVARSSQMNFDAAGTGLAVPSLRLRADNLYPYNERGVNRKRTTPVGSFPPNALGIYDMSGNAWEWCSDTGGTNYTSEKQINPCAQGGSGHILRGGTYDTDAKACRASARIDWQDRAWCSASGFRVALTVQ
jgi:formylglycine-generating enzyme required for sulfatase activity